MPNAVPSSVHVLEIFCNVRFIWPAELEKPYDELHMNSPTYDPLRIGGVVIAWRSLGTSHTTGPVKVSILCS